MDVFELSGDDIEVGWTGGNIPQEYTDHHSERTLSGVDLTGNIISKKLTMSSLSDEEQFYAEFATSLKSLNDMGVVTVPMDEAFTLKEKSANLRYIVKKNPTLYILGYVITNGGRAIDKERFDTLTNKRNMSLIRSVNTIYFKGEITPPDVLRYCRLWMEMK
jgi:hypothetical protein